MMSLAMRPDIAAVRYASKQLFRAGGGQDRINYVGWLLLAHRLFDPACIQSVLVPFCCGDEKQACLVELDHGNVKELKRRLRAYNEEAALVVFGSRARWSDFAQVQSNPTGSASAHSGHSFLNDLAKSVASVNDLRRRAEWNAERFFLIVDGENKADLEEWQEDAPKLMHTGQYYTMSMLRISLHSLQHASTHSRHQWPSCETTPDLWDALLAYDGGAKAGAIRFG